MAGSKTDFPQDLMEQVRRLEEIFTVDQKKLKEITDHFISELAKGNWTPGNMLCSADLDSKA